MKKILAVALLCVIATGCGGKEEKKKEGFQVTRTEKPEEATNSASQEIPVDMSNTGIGPIKELTFPAEIDQELAATGETKFKQLCVACHMPNKRMIGPAMAGVYERRNPAWVMNMIMNPTEMIQKDPIAKALLKEYNNAVMLNQNLSQEEARALAEYLRTL